jgi:hypothetical protein
MDGPPLWRQTHRHGRGRATDLPQVRGQSDFNTACRWHGTAGVAVFRVRPPRSYENRSSDGLDQERATATEIDARALVPSTAQCYVALTCLCSCLTLEWRDAGQGNTRSLGITAFGAYSVGRQSGPVSDAPVTAPSPVVAQPVAFVGPATQLKPFSKFIRFHWRPTPRSNGTLGGEQVRTQTLCWARQSFQAVFCPATVRYGASSRISTRPKSISCAKCCLLIIQLRLAAMSFSVQRKSMASKPKWASGSVSFSILLFSPSPELDQPGTERDDHQDTHLLMRTKPDARHPLRIYEFTP